MAQRSFKDYELAMLLYCTDEQICKLQTLGQRIRWLLDHNQYRPPPAKWREPMRKHRILAMFDTDADKIDRKNPSEKKRKDIYLSTWVGYYSEAFQPALQVGLEEKVRTIVKNRRTEISNSRRRAESEAKRKSHQEALMAARKTNNAAKAAVEKPSDAFVFAAIDVLAETVRGMKREADWNTSCGQALKKLRVAMDMSSKSK